MRTSLLPCLFLLACTIDEDRFGEVVAEDWCADLKGCDSDVFWDEYREGTPECRTRVAETVDDRKYGNGVAKCTFLPDVAEACLDRLRSAPCEEVLDPDFVEDCTDAWDCVQLINPG